MPVEAFAAAGTGSWPERQRSVQFAVLGADPPGVDALLDAFALVNNTHRPHRALGRRTPHAAYAARPKTTRPTASPEARVRCDRIDSSGVVTLRHDRRLHHIGVGHKQKLRTR